MKVFKTGLAIIVIAGLLATSCAQHTCPTYSDVYHYKRAATAMTAHARAREVR